MYIVIWHLRLDLRHQLLCGVKLLPPQSRELAARLAEGVTVGVPMGNVPAVVSPPRRDHQSTSPRS
jgi:hypothetical protein